MALHTTSFKIKAIKARIIQTDDYKLVGKIIIKNAESLASFIPECIKAVNILNGAADIIKNSMIPGNKNIFNVHKIQNNLDFVRNIMISGYEQVELIESAWGQFAVLINTKQVINDFETIKNEILRIYNMAKIAPSIGDTKQVLWDYDQVEDNLSIQKKGAYLLSTVHESREKYINLIVLYKKLVDNNMISASYINGILNYKNNQDLILSIPGNQTPRNRFL